MEVKLKIEMLRCGLQAQYIHHNIHKIQMKLHCEFQARCSSSLNMELFEADRGTFGCLLLVFYILILTPDDGTVGVPKHVRFIT
jgi:hypothetical protein